jgi:hypothetical protein
MPPYCSNIEIRNCAALSDTHWNDGGLREIGTAQWGRVSVAHFFRYLWFSYMSFIPPPSPFTIASSIPRQSAPQSASTAQPEEQKEIGQTQSDRAGHPMYARRSVSPLQKTVLLQKPFRKLDHAEIGHAIDKLQEQFEAIRTSGQIPEGASASQWNVRLGDTDTILRKMKRATYSESSHVAFASASEKCNGLLMMRIDDVDPEFPPMITEFATLPGTKGIGGRLLEQAVQYSDKVLKCGGKIKLISVEDEAFNAFEELGFIVQGFTMTLDPEMSDKWAKDDQGNYRLIKHLPK